MFRNIFAHGNSRSVRLVFLGAALLIAVMYDWFIWDKTIGLGFLLYVLSTVAIFLLFITPAKEERQRWSLFLLVPIIILSATPAIYNNNFVHFVVPWIVLVCTMLFFMVYPVANPDRQPFSFLNLPLLRSIDLPFTKWAAMYADLFRWRDDPKQDVVRRILIGVLIAVPLLLVFGALFAAADDLFADWIKRVLDFSPVDLWRVFRTFVFTLFIGSLFYVFIGRDYVLGNETWTPRQFDTLVVTIVLGSVNALFAAFLFFQFTYLFGGAEFVLKNALTFADYARKGFFQLVWVMVIAAALLIVIYRSFSAHKRSVLVSVLQVLLIAQVAVVAASALKRMNLYQAEYGYTVLRLYVEWFIYFVLLILSVAGVCIVTQKSFRTFWHLRFILGLAALTVVACLNVDGLIARENVRRFVEEKKSIDLNYLNTLSVDALPALASLRSNESAFLRLELTERAELLGILRGFRNRLWERNQWQEVNLNTWRMKKMWP